ncbi:nitroreductase family protein [Variovorax arabinosiphilus]|uniref:nitroreductase family protein n=1 Tax=Variovorax arabinosiphilus TaxID=3053498 RepID=UPI002574E595|nr:MULTISPECIES: nitroreductase family protein [unclassified Variovorax]MDM0118405.1 nitroreductase family protein [Variovorax sp. J2L1-78]MDM0128830.1 nitroreductase family protein [Variovorax sp. J2L1-63]MDM0233384.1 nitroreductase family protein [Variovorax sp. J2R1-6]
MNALAAPELPACAPARRASTALAPWLTRRSVGPRRLVLPGPDTSELALLLQAAVNVSDHGRKRPCRIVVADAAQRERYADAFLAYAASVRGLASPDLLDAAVREHERTKAFNGPCLLSVVAHIATDDPEVPPHEQWMSVGASLGALLAAANALGYAGKALSGARIRHPAVRSVVCGDSELLACFVYLGGRPANC